MSSPAQSTGGGTASFALFPVAVGNTWVYDVSDGGTRTDKMTSVTPVPAGQQVVMTSRYSGLTTGSRATFIFRSDGSLELPANQFGRNVTVSGGGIFWPPAAQIASGQPSKSTLHITINLNGQHIRETAHLTVQGAGTASVTVPAGTYQATIIDTTMTETVEGFPVQDVIRTWMVNGVGPVKSEDIIDDGGTGHILSAERLQSFTRG